MKKIFTFFAALAMLAGVAKAQVTEVTIAEVQATYYAADNDLYIVMADDASNPNYVFCFDVVCPAGQQDINDSITYTLSDMIADYSYMADYGLMAYVRYKTVSLTRIEGSYEIYVTDSNDRQFHIVYTNVPPMTDPIDTVYLTMNNKLYNRLVDATATQGVFQLVGADADVNYYLYFAVNSTSIAGTYTLDDVNTQYTALYLMDDPQNPTEIKLNNLLPNAVVTGSATNCQATVNYVGKDSVLYVITFNYAEPVATTTTNENFEETLVIEQNQYYSQYQSQYGVYAYDIYATNANYILYGTVFNPTSDDAYGVWDYADGYIEFNLYDIATQTAASEVYSSTLTIANVAGVDNVTGSALFYGDYQVNITATGTGVGINNAETNNVIATAEGRSIVLKGAQGQMVDLFDVNGRMLSHEVATEDAVRMNVQNAGVYMIRVNGKTSRVVVK